MTAAKITWIDPEELVRASGAAASPFATARASDEFPPAVAAAIADLRRRHGLPVDEPAHDHTHTHDAAVDPSVPESLVPAGGLNRRGFLQLTGAAAVAALAAGCGSKNEAEKLAPHLAQPEGTTLGKAVHYATVVRDSGRPVPVVVKTYDGRPIKIEGNPDCALTKGRADARTQAALLNLYDPDRFQDGPQKRVGDRFEATTWKELDEKVGEALKTGTIGLITPAIDGLARSALLGQLREALGDRLKVAILDPLDRGHRAEFQAKAFNGPQSSADLNGGVTGAEVIVCFGGDLVAEADLATQVAFAESRRASAAKANRQLIVLEPVLSQTGSMADVRVRAGFDQMTWIAWAAAELVAKAGHGSLPEDAKNQLDRDRAGLQRLLTTEVRPIAVADAAERTRLQAEIKRRFGFDLDASAGIPIHVWIALQLVTHPQKALAWAAGGVHDHPSNWSLVAAAHWLNDALANKGRSPNGEGYTRRAVMVNKLVSSEVLLKAAGAGELSVLIVWGCNPAYVLPGFAAAVRKVPVLVALTDRLDETARLAHWIAPTTHDLESWGDAEISGGMFAVQQPVIRPLWDSRQAEESLLAFSGQVKDLKAAIAAMAAAPALSVVSRRPLWQASAQGLPSWQEFVRAVWKSQWKSFGKDLLDSTANESSFWQAALVKGVVQVPSNEENQNRETLHRNFFALATLAPFPPLTPAAGLRLVLTPSRVMGDGTWANNAWLQECPDPVSKITWDTYAAISPADAESQGIREGDVLKLTPAGAEAFLLPAHIQDGQHPGWVEVFLGWGRAAGCAGAVADLGREESYPFNAFTLTDGPRWGRPVTLEKTGKTYVLACTQGHQRMEGRDLAREIVVGAHAGPHAAHPAGGGMHHSEHVYPGHKWGMAIDLSLCTGCNACLIACNAENNVPVVGRDEVRRNREMHWIRVDRYFSSPAEKDGKPNRLDVDVIHQPVMCQQCDKAPCEAVCPANATVHNDEGINVQIYNRCIGTRYCSNNCPYKVRRFNWYEYSAYRAGPTNVANPLTRIAKNLATTGGTSTSEELSHAPLAMMLNPEVTSRMRGVMEKCNFCLQRTREVRYGEKASNRAAADGSVQTACSQTCPSAAITFGDLNDPQSQVARQTAQAAGYRLLDELGAKPSVTYLPRLRNRTLAAVGGSAPAATSEHRPEHGKGG